MEAMDIFRLSVQKKKVAWLQFLITPEYRTTTSVWLRTLSLMPALHKGRTTRSLLFDRHHHTPPDPGI